MAVAPTGLTVLYAPDHGQLNPRRAEVDIVFVHGLQGHPENTWTWRHKARDTDLNFSNLNLFNKAPMTSKVSFDEPTAPVYWPKDLLPSICPEARILTFGYDTLVTRGYGSVNQGNIFAHARDLLYELVRTREPGRSLVFVAHSLGGIVVKEVLRRSETTGDAVIKDVILSTAGVVFMGTPHRGSPELASMADTVRRIAQTVMRMNTNQQIIRALGLDGPELELCRETFIAQWEQYKFQVKTFQEAKPLTGFKASVFGEKVVPDTSSRLDDSKERAETINANHMDMCRFNGLNDPGFRKVGSVIQEFSRFRLLDFECSKALAFPEMSFREHSVREPLPSTCNWFFNLQVYRNWERRSDPSLFGRFLWVKGKPGAGKSTLVKEAVRRNRRRNDTNVIIGTFFFNARGTTLQHTPLGMLRSICWHIFNQDNHFKGCVVDHYRAKPNSTRGQWFPEENELRTLVLNALETRPTSAPRIVLFIDALDECEESGARDIIRYLATLLDVADKSGQQLDLCLSSRHYPTISSPRGFDIVVDDANRGDILHYIQDKIPLDIMPRRQSVELLHSMILQKSSGIFLWVVLVIDIVLQDVDEGKTAVEIEQSLKEAPSDLLTLFSDIIGTIRPRERANAMQLIHWVLLVNAPLTVPDLRAIQVCHNRTTQPFGAGPAERPQTVQQLSLMWDGDVVRMRRQVCSMSRGLIEVKDVVQEKAGKDAMQPRPIIQFVHETVREFFMAEGSRLFQAPKFLEIGHISILRTCAQALCVPNLGTRRQLRQDDPDLSLFGSNLDLSFLQRYSVDRLLFHAISARRNMTLPNSIIHLAGRIATMISRRAFVGRSAWHIVRWAKSFPQDKAKSLEPLLVYDQQLDSCAGSLALACTNVLEALENNQGTVDPPIPGSPASLLQSSLEDWCTYPHSLSDLSRPSATEFTQARHWKDRQTLSTLHVLLTNRLSLDIADMEGNTLLHFSSWLGMTEVTQLLLEQDLNPNLLNYYGMSPLSLACEYGQTAVASLLLSKWTKVNLPGPGGYTPLHLAVEQSHFDLVNLLIFHDANPQAADVYGSTPLHVGAKFGAKGTVIKALINANADLNALNQDGQSPLEIAKFYSNDLSDWSLNPRNRWGGHTTNFRKTVASRTQHRHSYLTPKGEMVSAWAPPARPRSVGSSAAEGLSPSTGPGSRSSPVPGGNENH